MRTGAHIIVGRLTAAAVIVAALGVQAWADLTYGTFTWGQLPGYFTPLAAICAVVALVAAAATGGNEPRWVALLRVNSATYGVVTGVVYWSLLAGVATPVFPWANLVLHGGSGAILVVDWLLVGRRRVLPVRTWWTVLAIPAIWLAYLMARAFVDGWVPYPFLDPAQGLGVVATSVLAIAVVGLGVAAVLHVACLLRTEHPSAGVTDSTPTGRV
ncbi:Pr6Pr family membrane protein [uncultured Demequina sp.]|uniref:Pr6Pr family membrane protein n=1 Tax=uncultured Demequina sp. TaxID=693499 RepID=UPI0025E34F5F|nr:Pr6Pr family membrane protein [uncultured Demequina sp.]